MVTLFGLPFLFYNKNYINKQIDFYEIIIKENIIKGNYIVRRIR
jgi:hypothetical protein